MRPLTTTDIFGRQAMGLVHTPDFVDWAVSMLDTGQDSPSLRMLAALDSTADRFEAEALFKRAAEELHITEPPDGLLAYACEVARRIVAGDISPRRGVHELFQVWVASDHARDYLVWLELDDALDAIEAGAYHYVYPNATADNFDAIALSEARAFLDRMWAPGRSEFRK